MPRAFDRPAGDTGRGHAVGETSPVRPDVSAEDRSRLEAIEAKVDRAERLSFDDGVFLYQTPDLTAVGRLANRVRERLHGNRAFFNVNRHLNPTNICYVECALCAWARKPGQEGGYLMGLQEAVDHAAETWNESVTEFHIVGGLHPTLPFFVAKKGEHGIERVL